MTDQQKLAVLNKYRMGDDVMRAADRRSGDPVTPDFSMAIAPLFQTARAFDGDNAFLLIKQETFLVKVSEVDCVKASLTGDRPILDFVLQSKIAHCLTPEVKHCRRNKGESTKWRGGR
jgi:hypothetical protein